MDIIGFFKGIIEPWQAQLLVYFVVANLVMGIAASFKVGDFKLSRLADFWKRASCVFVAYIGVSFIARVAADFSPLQTFTWAALSAMLGKHIIKNFVDLTGFEIPTSLNRYL